MLPYNCRTVKRLEVIPVDAATKPRAKARKPRPKPRAKARLEARIDTELDDLIVEAAERLNVTKTTFVADAVREAALRVIARADVTLMAAEVFDQMIASLEIADESPELEELATLPRRITR
jgi:uncharacterized protein (DUF1778 family)